MTLGRRLWTYQAERFPLVKTVPLLAVFSAASINVSAFLADRPLPGMMAYVTGFLLAFIIFFQMRAADEWKDQDIDARYRPERPVPRGLVSLQEIVSVASIAAPVAFTTALIWSPALVWLLVLVWVWFAAMTFEFGAKAWLTARPVIYLISHMAIMPLIDLLLTGVEWAGRHDPAPALWTFLALSLVNGCVLEIGRKCWAPASEREGVESYSRLWGPEKAAMIWLSFVGAAALLLVLLGIALRATLPFAGVAVLIAIGAATVALRFRAHPNRTAEKRLDAASGLCVLVCYATAGFLPLLWNSP